MADTKKKNKKQITLKPGTAAYTYLDKPDTGHKYSNNKFKTTMVYDDDFDLIEHIEAAVVELAEAEWGDTVDIDEVKRPFRLAEDQEKEQFEGKITLNASTKYKPMLFDAKRKKLKSSVKIFSGDEIAAIVDLLPYESTEKVREGKKTVTVTVYGVSAQLKAVQLITKNSGGGVDASAFGEYDDGFDSDDYEDQFDDQSEDEENEDDDNGDF